MTGTAEPGATIIINDLVGGLIGTATANGDGVWTTQITENDGIHFYTIISEGRSGSYHTDTHLIHVDVESRSDFPGELPLPTITSPADGELLTDGENVVVSGTSAPGGAVVQLQGQRFVPLGVALADPVTGAWSITLESLPDGLHPFLVTYGVGDRQSGHSTRTYVHVDTGVTSLERPVVEQPGRFEVVRSSTLAISGTAAPNADMQILNYDAVIATTTSDGTGAWEVTVEVPGGIYLISAASSTADGSRSANAAPVSMVVNTSDDVPRVCR